MKTITGCVFVLMLIGLFAGCDRPPKSGLGFVFPEGDATRGQTAFVELKCYSCHRVDQSEGIPAPIVDPILVVMLGGETAKVRTYGDLVTAIIHPSYTISDKVPGPKTWEIAKLPMPTVNDQMTVTQLLDIVTYLQAHYRPLEPLYHQQFYVP